MALHALPRDGPEITIRPMVATDDAFCRALFHEDRGSQYATLALDDRMLSMLLDQQFRAQQTGYRQQHPAAAYCMIEHGGMSVGRVIIERTGDPPRSTLHLVDIVIRHSARGRGIGSKVIRYVGAAAHSDGATGFTLTVLQTNARAMRFYERLGFVATTNGSHILMAKQLS